MKFRNNILNLKMQSKVLENKENDLNNMSQHSVLNAFDFTAIDEMDPSLGMLKLLISLNIFEIF